MTKYEKYKIVLIGIFVFGFLFCFNSYTQNGRYVVTSGNWHMDTRTGNVYTPKGVKVDVNYKE
jgi:hypothetical protein